MGEADGTQLVGVNHATGLVAAQSRLGVVQVRILAARAEILQRREER